MAYNESTQAVTVEAGSTIVANRFLVMASDGQVDHAGAQAAADGISGDAAVADQDLPMIIPNGAIASIELGATLAAGALVASNASGQAIAHGGTGGDVCMGRLKSGGSSGEIAELVFSPKTTA